MIVNSKSPMGFASKIWRKRVARFEQSLEELASDEAKPLNERDRENYSPEGHRKIEAD